MVLRKASRKLVDHTLYACTVCISGNNASRGLTYSSGQDNCQIFSFTKSVKRWKSTAGGFTIELIWVRHAHNLSHSMKNKTLLSFYTTIEMQRKKERKWGLTATHIHTETCTHTHPNLSHISLTVLSEDVYRLARDLFPIWQSQEHLNGPWKKCPAEFFIWIFARLGLFELYSHTFTNGLMSFHYLVIRHLAANTSKITPRFMLHTCPKCTAN